MTSRTFRTQRGGSLWLSCCLRKRPTKPVQQRATIVRGTVEETLNAMLEAEAERLCNAGRYERIAVRRDQRAGTSDRKLQTEAGEVAAEGSEEGPDREVLGRCGASRTSPRRLTRVNPGTASNLNKKIYCQIEAWRNQPIEGAQPYLNLDGIVLKRSWAGEVRKVPLLVAISVNGKSYWKILGIVEGAKEEQGRIECLPEPPQAARPARLRADRLGCLRSAPTTSPKQGTLELRVIPLEPDRAGGPIVQSIALAMSLATFSCTAQNGRRSDYDEGNLNYPSDLHINQLQFQLELVIWN